MHPGMCVYIKIAPYCRSTIECTRNLELKMPSKKYKITIYRASKKKRSKSTLRHWLAVIANRNQAFSIRHKGTHHENFKPCRRMCYILTSVRVALATSDAQRILEIPATDEIHMEDRNYGLAWTKPNNGIYWQHAKQSTDLCVKTAFESCGARMTKRRNKSIHRAREA